MSNIQGFLNFPKQKISDKKKTEDYYKECIDFAENVLATDNELKQSFKNKNENYNLRSNIIDRKNVEKTLNPDKLDLDTLPATFQHIGIGNNKINLLIGEYIKRRKEFKAYLSASDKDGLGRREKTLTKELTQKAIELIQKSDIDPQEIEQEMKKLEKYAKYDFQDIAEMTANKILNREIKEQNIEFLFTRIFEDLLISGEQIADCRVLGGLPVINRIDSRNCFTIGGSSMYVHDSDIIVTYNYQSVGTIIDDYYDKLKEKDIDFLETGYTATGSTSLGLNRDISIMERYGPDSGIELLSPGDIGNRLFSGAFDTQGNVRVVKACWRGKRKIGKRTYFDEDGVKQQDYVPDTYKVDEDAGEEVKWLWVNEWQQATKIGDSVYVDMGPVPYASLSMVNKSKGMPPIVGIMNATNGNKVQSLTDMTKPLDYSFDVAYFKRELQMATHVGSMTAINSSLVPSGWSPEKWMHYAKINKFMFLDPTNEILKGPSQGKSAGNFNTLTATEINIDNSRSVQMYTDYMFDLEDKIGKISGVHGGREGQIQNREAVGNVQREVTQTSHITEKWFALEGQFRKITLGKFLECCKFAYKENPRRGQYMLDDMGMAMVASFDEFVSSDMDIHIADSTDDTELFHEIKELGQAAIQNGNATIADLVSMRRSVSIQDMARKLEDSSDKIRQQAEVQQKEALASAEKVKQMEAKTEEEKLAFEKYKVDLEAQIKREEIAQKRQDSVLKAGITREGNLARLDTDGNGIDDELDLRRTDVQENKNIEDAKIKREQLAETERHNRETEKIAKSKPKPSK